MGDTSDRDRAWGPVCYGARRALENLGYHGLPNCLPDENPCGGSFREHAAAYLATIKAVADHHLAHLEPPPGIAQEIYLRAYRDLAVSEYSCEVPR